MAIFCHFPLEFVEINGVVREGFWELISRQTEFQRKHLKIYGQIERELGWVNISKYRMAFHWQTAEEHWLCNFIRSIRSFMPVYGFILKTYIIPFNGGIPHGDVFFVQIYCDGPYCMDYLREQHLRAQSFYTLQHAKTPAVRREENRLILLHLIVSTCDPHWIVVYNFLYPGPSRTLANHSYGSRIPAREFLLLSFAILFRNRASQAEGNDSLQQEMV
ncbi:hypothetical protein SUGI_0995550 [Cryptomeria japonica]|nr:hypothetical protein SUGI_0995550 [Cryptomeria japonica]